MLTTPCFRDLHLSRLAGDKTITVDFPLLHSSATLAAFGSFQPAPGADAFHFVETGFRVFLWHSAASGPSFFLRFVLALSGGTSFPGRR
jgi:hypothetical protein